jgi:hypothetical protein
MSTNTEAIKLAKRHADAIVGIGDVRGWERPSEYGRLVALGAAAKAAIREAGAVAPVPWPTAAEEVDDWITAVANARVLASARHTAAEDLALEADRQVARLGQTLAVEAIPRLVSEFADHLATYATLTDAPRALSGHETAKEAAAHMTLLRCAADMAASLIARGLIADITGEGEAIGADAVWLVLAPTAHAGLDATSEAVRTFHQTMPSTVADWDSLVPLGLTLAHFGEAETRIQRHTAANYTRGSGSFDGGMVERTYAEVESGAHR